jgi:hypothetical protein
VRDDAGAGAGALGLLLPDVPGDGSLWPAAMHRGEKR